ncbi:hypothetical protein BP6252_07500 [Coleophoma cylindrospora]|uniref:gamma-glutamylcyclotransferase n=1 Tax=Coleophoma cylindrospora TaxID=1849047 RepID=A0A3D8RA62_9HELO|nr:hypothetical protein BP6252_07500 [Coleophoma cylindrospora]
MNTRAIATETLSKEKVAREARVNGSAPVWYFGYGSNMRASVMASRSITPQNMLVVRVQSHVLTFDVFGFPYTEPSMASIAERSQVHKGTTVLCHNELTDLPPVHGIAYLISREDYVRLVISEGGGVAYREVELEAEIIHDDPMLAGKKLVVLSLEAKYPFRPNATPSMRYLGLLINGAAEQKLPEDYQEYLKLLKSYRTPESNWTRFGGYVFLSFWKPILNKIVKYMKANTDSNGHCEQWIEKLIVYGYAAMWTTHNKLHCHLWGRGDGRDDGTGYPILAT